MRGGSPISVGQQLAQRRRELDIPQGVLARLVGVTVTTVSGTENDRSAIQRGKRHAWERALRLRPGTISRAYEHGKSIEPLSVAAGAPYADMNDKYERAVWQMAISEADRVIMIDLLRESRREERGRRPA